MEWGSGGSFNDWGLGVFTPLQTMLVRVQLPGANTIMSLDYVLGQSGVDICAFAPIA